MKALIKINYYPYNCSALLRIKGLISIFPIPVRDVIRITSDEKLEIIIDPTDIIKLEILSLNGDIGSGYSTEIKCPKNNVNPIIEFKEYSDSEHWRYAF